MPDRRTPTIVPGTLPGRARDNAKAHHRRTKARDRNYGQPARRSRPRFEVHYVLRNLDTSEFLVVKAAVDDPDPTLPSAVPLWLGADWMEREVFDMYGVKFVGHPDLRRILMPHEFAGHPLRKDYPLRGYGERHNFSTVTRSES